MQNIHMNDLKDIYQNLAPGEIILDVRTPEEFNEGHLSGAINISHDQVKEHSEELKKYSKLYVHCRSGRRVQLAGLDLMEAGIQNLVLITDSGIEDWKEAGLPLSRD